MAIAPMLNDIVNFQLVQNGIVGDERTGATVLAPSMTYQVARFIDPEIAAKHAALFPYFKEKVQGVDDPNGYQYFTIQLPNGRTEVIGYPWVNDVTFVTVKGRTRTYVVSNFEEKMNAPLAKALRDLGATYTTHDNIVS